MRAGRVAAPFDAHAPMRHSGRSCSTSRSTSTRSQAPALSESGCSFRDSRSSDAGTRGADDPSSHTALQADAVLPGAGRVADEGDQSRCRGRVPRLGALRGRPARVRRSARPARRGRRCACDLHRRGTSRRRVRSGVLAPLQRPGVRAGPARARAVPDPWPGVPARERRPRHAIAPTFGEIGKLAAIAAIRTVLNYFLAKEIERERAEVEGSDSTASYPHGRADV